ncbi:unnamed protein product [Rotaria sp. Silwood2]|nr:unnamed protein product [Rotaria sp. Silwood2]
MQRSQSIESITSVTSSCRGGEKKPSPTHMIIQREADTKIMLLPVTHLVNSSVTRIKINNTATFKSDINSRKQHRGEIVQLGEYSTTIHIFAIFLLHIGTKEVCQEQFQVFETTADADQKNTHDDGIDDINENEKYEKRKERPINGSSSNEDEEFRNTSNDSLNINISSTKSIRNSTTTMSKTKDSSSNRSIKEHEAEPQKASKSQIIINPRPENPENLENETTLINFSNLAIPDAAGLQWFINMEKYFSNKAPGTNIANYAKALGIKDPRDLVACIEDTTSNTARQVVRCLYSSDKLLTMTGPEVPEDRRLIIREFAESQKGPISNHKFNEAINGVFRSKKCELKTKMQQHNELMTSGDNKSIDKQINCRDKGQRSLKQMMNKNQHSKPNEENYDSEEDPEVNE